jgi:hypothetical protein
MMQRKEEKRREKKKEEDVAERKKTHGPKGSHPRPTHLAAGHRDPWLRRPWVWFFFFFRFR